MRMDAPPIVGFEGPAQQIAIARRDLARHASEHQRELLATDAGDEIHGPALPPHDLGRAAQDFIANGMPQSIVDDLEVVEIGDGERERLARSARRGDLIAADAD